MVKLEKIAPLAHCCARDQPRIYQFSKRNEYFSDMEISITPTKFEYNKINR